MKRKREESGFALLLVFLLAASIAIGLYIEMPRVAFESQRQREQLLISRGEQYKRAIQLYYRKYHTYPQNLDDLETTKNIRFLRRRYKDPMTGKEWRLIHMGPGGILTDSLVTPANANPLDPTKSKQTADNSQSGTGTGDASGSTGPVIDPATGQPVNQGLNMAARRPSDRTIGNGPEQPGVYNQDPNQQPGQQPQYPAPGQPQYPGQPVQPQYPGQPVQPQYPGQPVDPNQPGQQPQYPGQPGQPVYPGQPGQPIDPSQPVQPQYPGQPVQPQYPGQPGYPQPQYPGQPQYPQPQYPGQPVQPAYPLAPPGAPPGAYNPATGQPYQPMPYPGQGRGGLMPQYPGQPQTAGAMPGAQGQNQATNLINNILTTARQPPGGMGLGGGGTGLAGVASTAQGTGIHIVNDRKKYKEWEFIYDLKNDKTTGVGQLMQQQQQMMQQQGAPGTQGGAFGSQPGQGGPGTQQPPSQPTSQPPNQ